MSGKIGRIGFASIVTLTLAPLVGQAIWRPLASWRNLSVNAAWLSLVFLSVALAVVAGEVGRAWQLRSPSRVISTAGAGGLAILCAVFLGKAWQPSVVAGIVLLSVVGIASWFLPYLINELPHELDALPTTNRKSTVLFALMALACITQTTRVSIFIGDPTRVEFQLIPQERFIETHSCLTAYVHASKLASQRVENLYEGKHWPAMHSNAGEGSAKNTNKITGYEPFDLDTYAYPPPFLILSSLLLPWQGKYIDQRAIWFGINGVFLAVGLWMVARWLRDERWYRALLLAPLVWVSLPTLVTLQVGNVHTTVMVIAMLGMVAFDQKRPLVGGTLLSFAILSKISPGILVVWLLLQKRWRDAGWTALCGLVWLVATIVFFGWSPLRYFVVYELPRLSSGEALRFMIDTPSNIVMNMSPFGIPFRMTLLGVTMANIWGKARLVGLVFSAWLLFVTIAAGRRTGSRSFQACTWLALLTLGAFRSPFAPGYVLFSALWMLSLLAIEVRHRRSVVGLCILWPLWSLLPPFPPAIGAVYGTVLILLLLVVISWVAIRAPKSEPVPT
jgi:alpha-1,2-mannosyltransferase